MKFAFIAQEVAFPVETMCRVLGVTRRGFYAWKKRPKPARAKSDAQLSVKVAAAHQRSRKTYGSPRVHRELKAQGVRVGKKRIERLMRENGLQGRSKATLQAHDGLEARRPHRPQHSRPEVLQTRAEPSLGHRRHSHRHRRGVAVPRTHARPSFSPRRGLGDERKQRHGPGSRRASKGAASAAASARALASLRPRQPLRQRRLSD